ncbi:MAG: hypothetical protein MMC33_009911 [Icmadophila ericetorum]|nr:hypothetical protein [Icmadophila ericetorum]
MKTLSIPYFTSFLFLSAISAVRGNPVIATLAAVETKKPCTTTLTIPPTFYTRPITTTYIDSIVVTETKTVNCNGCVLTTVNGRNPGGPIVTNHLLLSLIDPAYSNFDLLGAIFGLYGLRMFLGYFCPEGIGQSRLAVDGITQSDEVELGHAFLCQ